MWGLSGAHTPLTQEGDAYRVVSAWVIGFSFWRARYWSFQELFQSTEMSGKEDEGRL